VNIKKFAVALAIPVVSLALASPASATDADKYFSELSSGGLSINSDNRLAALAAGLAVCVDMFNGVPMRQELGDIVEAGFSQKQAVTIMSAAVRNLCPAAASRAA
jgi:hypothetical protein